MLNHAMDALQSQNVSQEGPDHLKSTSHSEHEVHSQAASSISDVGLTHSSGTETNRTALPIDEIATFCWFLVLMLLTFMYPQTIWDFYQGTCDFWISSKLFNIVIKVLSNQKTTLKDRPLVRIIMFDLFRCLAGAVANQLIFEGPNFYFRDNFKNVKLLGRRALNISIICIIA